MSDVLFISGLPSRVQVERLGEHLASRIAATGWSADHLRLRTFPAEPLLGAAPGVPESAEAAERVAEARGIVLATPTCEAARSGLLKTFLDLLPPFDFGGKAVLPLLHRRQPRPRAGAGMRPGPGVRSLAALPVGRRFFLRDNHIAVEEEIEGPSATRFERGTASATFPAHHLWWRFLCSYRPPSCPPRVGADTGTGTASSTSHGDLRRRSSSPLNL